MDYFQISKLLEEALDNVLEDQDATSQLAGFTHKIFNQGARAMFHEALIRIAKAENGGLNDVQESE